MNETSILRVLQKQESIAKAIQVPHRPQQIQICNHYFGAFKNKEQVELLCPLSVFLLFDVSNLMCNSSCKRKKSVENYFFYKWQVNQL